MSEPLFKKGDWVEILYDYKKDFPNEPVKYFAQVSSYTKFVKSYPYSLEGISFSISEKELKLVEWLKQF